MNTNQSITADPPRPRFDGSRKYEGDGIYSFASHNGTEFFDVEWIEEYQWFDLWTIKNSHWIEGCEPPAIARDFRAMSFSAAAFDANAVEMVHSPSVWKSILLETIDPAIYPRAYIAAQIAVMKPPEKEAAGHVLRCATCRSFAGCSVGQVVVDDPGRLYVDGARYPTRPACPPGCHYEVKVREAAV